MAQYTPSDLDVNYSTFLEAQIGGTDAVAGQTAICRAYKNDRPSTHMLRHAGTAGRHCMSANKLPWSSKAQSMEAILAVSSLPCPGNPHLPIHYGIQGSHSGRPHVAQAALCMTHPNTHTAMISCHQSSVQQEASWPASSPCKSLPLLCLL